MIFSLVCTAYMLLLGSHAANAFTMTSNIHPSTSKQRQTAGGSSLQRKDFLNQIVGAGAAAVALAGVTAAPLASVAAAPPAVGSMAPDFTLPSNTGRDISLNDLLKKAKHTVLYFYPGDFTSGCTLEAQILPAGKLVRLSRGRLSDSTCFAAYACRNVEQGFQKDFSKYGEKDAQIVGVSVDSIDKHLDFQKSYGLQFPLLSDIGANVADLYGSKLEIPFMGKFANRLTFIIGSDGKVEKVFTDVEGKVAKHSEQVLASLSALG